MFYVNLNSRVVPYFPILRAESPAYFSPRWRGFAKPVHLRQRGLLMRLTFRPERAGYKLPALPIPFSPIIEGGGWSDNNVLIIFFFSPLLRRGWGRLLPTYFLLKSLENACAAGITNMLSIFTCAGLLTTKRMVSAMSSA